MFAMYAFGSIIAKYAFQGILCGKFDGWRAIAAPPAPRKQMRTAPLETPAECKNGSHFRSCRLVQVLVAPGKYLVAKGKFQRCAAGRASVRSCLPAKTGTPRFTPVQKLAKFANGSVPAVLDKEAARHNQLPVRSADRRPAHQRTIRAVAPSRPVDTEHHTHRLTTLM